MATQKQQQDLKALFAGGGVALRLSFGTGAAAATNITITGIKKGDVIVGAIHIDGSGIMTTDLFAEISITADNTVQNSTTSTAGGKVLVVWKTKM